MKNLLRVAWHTIQYLYYLRFAILLWIALPAIAWIDKPESPSPLLHAIFTPEYPGQFLGGVFFATGCAMVALLLARIIIINGPDRFPRPGENIPNFLRVTLGEGSIDPNNAKLRIYSDRRAVVVLLFAQVPNIYLFYRLISNAKAEGVDLSACYWGDIWMMLGGLALATAFWYLISVLYYWTYPYDVFLRPARTLLYPRFLLGLPPSNQDNDPDTIERCGRLGGIIGHTIDKIFSLIPRPSRLGYSALPSIKITNPDLWEAHRLAFLGIFGCLGVYIFLFPITAPNRQPYGTAIALTGSFCFFLLLALSFSSVDIPTGSRKSRRKRNQMFGVNLCLAALSLFWFVRSLLTPVTALPTWKELWFRPPLQFFPVLGSVAVLLTILAFLLAAAGFFLDRFSFPVLTSFLMSIWFLHLVFPHGGDHYFGARTADKTKLPTPRKVIETRCPDPAKDCYLTIFAASGGGMHAAVWSSTVFIELEKAFAEHNPSPTTQISSFHQTVAFASTVSGGSIGFAPILREYAANNNGREDQGFAFDPKLYEHPTPDGLEEVPLYQVRIQQAAACSSLEAVAWGLEYSDFIHFLLPFLPPTHKYDRSNSLEFASARNYTEFKCGSLLPTPAKGHEDVVYGPSDLDHLSLGADNLKPSASIPAFTFNTTEVETGGRFLLANYQNPAAPVSGVYPAESFLQLYPANIGLVTAARLSATYPYVSSAARIDPDRYCPLAGHFVDGGYYDNDGIASVVEFLSAALLYVPGKSSDANVSCPKALKETLPKLHILIIEVRDGWDLDNAKSPESECIPKDGCKPGPSQQVEAPLITFWRSGHGSVSGRDRRELDILVNALLPLDLKTIVFSFPDNPPLSWHLTPCEIQEIRDQAGTRGFHSRIAAATSWAGMGALKRAENAAKSPSHLSSRCQATLSMRRTAVGREQ